MYTYCTFCSNMICNIIPRHNKYQILLDNITNLNMNINQALYYNNYKNNKFNNNDYNFVVYNKEDKHASIDNDSTKFIKQ